MINRFFDRTEKYIADGHERPIHYVVALVIVGAAFLVRYTLDPAQGSGVPFLFLYPAIFLAGWFGGMRPGLVATVFATGLAIYFLKSNPSAAASFQLPAPAQLGMFFASACLFCLLMGMMHHLVFKQRKSREEIAEQHEWFSVTLRSIGDAVIVTDRNGLIKFMNAEAERLSGWTEVEAEGRALRTVFRIISEESRNTVDDPVEKVFRENRVVGLANHTLLLSKDGREWPIEDSAAPVCNAKKDVLGVVLVFHDATESRRGHRALKAQAEELERKVLERTITLQRTVTDLESFSYTVSHDLRSPLRAMLGYSTALLEDFAEGMPEMAKDYLGRIKRAAERLDHLIQDLLTFSRISTESTMVQQVDLDRLVKEILLQYPDFHGDKAEIIVHGPLPAVLGHESALTQVLANLIGNAVKFVPKDRKPKIQIRSEPEEHAVKLWIEDNGIGIAKENQARIFKIFEQINNPGTYSGTGIGLALVKKSVEKMQGTVGVESREGEGSRFWVELLRVKQS